MSKNVKVSIKFYVYSSVKIILLNVMTVFILQLVLLLVQDMTRHFILLYLFYSTFLPSLLSNSFPDTLQEDSGLEPDKLRWLMSDRDKWRELLTRNSFQTSSEST